MVLDSCEKERGTKRLAKRVAEGGLLTFTFDSNSFRDSPSLITGLTLNSRSSWRS
jgi:hypothetical protein